MSLETRELIVNNQIAPKDGMFVDNPDHYFAVGRSALLCIRASMLAAGVETFANILDLPCGHGRVLRHLQSAFPEARLSACDIDTDAVDFCAATFGATPIYSHATPGNIPLEGDYDLIWVGSLLTHLNATACREFLNLFRTNLRVGGLLVFTIHGRAAADRMRRGVSTYGLNTDAIAQVLEQYAGRDFGYASYLDDTLPGISGNYGISLASPAWVFKEVARLPETRMLNYTESGWDNHQDVVGLFRERNA
jgi:SAM-dependent methyltransferase